MASLSLDWDEKHRRFGSLRLKLIVLSKRDNRRDVLCPVEVVLTPDICDFGGSLALEHTNFDNLPEPPRTGIGKREESSDPRVS